MPRRVVEVEAGADDGDRRSAAGQRAFVRSAVDPSARPETTTQPAPPRWAAKARAFSGLAPSRGADDAIAGRSEASMRPRT